MRQTASTPNPSTRSSEPHTPSGVATGEGDRRHNTSSHSHLETVEEHLRHHDTGNDSTEKHQSWGAAVGGGSSGVLDSSAYASSFSGIAAVDEAFLSPNEGNRHEERFLLCPGVAAEASLSWLVSHGREIEDPELLAAAPPALRGLVAGFLRLM